MIKRISLIFLGIVTALAFAQAKDNLMTGNITREEIRDCIVANQRWVPYPSYSDRAGWDELMGEARDMYIKKGEAYLNYSWNYVKTSSYLAFEKTGDRITYNHLWALHSAMSHRQMVPIRSPRLWLPYHVHRHQI